MSHDLTELRESLVTSPGQAKIASESNNEEGSAIPTLNNLQKEIKQLLSKETENNKKRKGRPRKDPLFDRSPKAKKRKTKEAIAVAHGNIIPYSFKQYCIEKDRSLAPFKLSNTTCTSLIMGSQENKEATSADVMEELRRMKAESTNIGNSIKAELQKDTAALKNEIGDIKSAIKKLEEEKNRDNDLIHSKLKEIEKELESCKAQIKRNSDSEIGIRLEDVQKKLDGLQKSTNDIENMTDAREKLQKVEYPLEAQRRNENENNIIIKGLDIPTGDERKLVTNFLVEKFQIDDRDITKVILIGKMKKIVKTKLKSRERKKKVMENKGKYLSKTNIFIENDLTKDEQEVQKKIRDFARQKKLENNQVKIGYKKVTINNTIWVWDWKKAELVNSGGDKARFTKRKQAKN